jgi:hypothetical protein
MTDRQKITDANIKPVGMFAVMRHTEELRSVRFACLHDTKASAMEEARRLAAETFGRYGRNPFCYYVVEIIGRVGYIDGRLQDGN